ncbi:MAG: cation transporter [Clostridia bacterium]|nr:cation transporter [Clostridia bacterium]
MDRSKQIVRVSIIGIIANIVLVAFKSAVGLISGSIAIVLDAVNNLSDALSSVITIVGTKLANRAPDKKHPYGHGRIEYISSITIAIIVLLAGVTSFKESVESILNPEAASYSTATVIIVAVAVLVKFFLGRYVKSQGTKYNSQSLVASGSDAIFDSVISLSTLVAAAISMIWGISVEGYLGVIISIVIIKAGVEILMESLSEIIGSRVDGDLSRRLKESVCAHEGVHGAYDLILHRYGPVKTIGSVHIEVDDCLTAREIHNLTRQISLDVFREYGIVLTVGIYASNTDTDEATKIKDSINLIIEDYPEILQIHGFYFDPETRRASFDMIVSFGSDAPAIREDVLKKLKKVYPEYGFDILLDTDFSD